MVTGIQIDGDKKILYVGDDAIHLGNEFYCVNSIPSGVGQGVVLQYHRPVFISDQERILGDFINENIGNETDVVVRSRHASDCHEPHCLTISSTSLEMGVKE